MELSSGNLISGNNGFGVEFRGTTTTLNVLQGNLIGTQIDGSSPLGNHVAGVAIRDSSNNEIGGTVAGAGNVIAFSFGGSGYGIVVFSGTGNAIRGNSIFSNAGLGIDLTGDGVTTNDAGDADIGANNLQNFPVLTAAQTGAVTTVSGTLNSTAGSTFTLEFFANDAPAPGIDQASILFTVDEGTAGGGAELGLPTDSILENQTVILSALFDSPNPLATHVVVIEWGDGGQSTLNLPAGQRGFSAPHQYLDDPSGTTSDVFTLQIAVTDESGGGSGFAEKDFTVNNVAPAFNDDLVFNINPASEGDTVNLTGSFTDPGTLDDHTVHVDWGDGSTSVVQLPAGVTNFNADHRFADDSGTNVLGQPNQHLIAVEIVDDDGGVDVAETGVQIVNVAPSVSIVGAPMTGLEGTPILLSALVNDPGLEDSFTYQSTATKDGSLFQTGTLPTFTLSPDDNGTFVVSLSVADDDGGVGIASAATIGVLNVNPTVDSGLLTLKNLAGDVIGQIQEGETVTLSGLVADAGPRDSQTVVADWGDGSPVDVRELRAVVADVVFIHTFRDDASLPGGIANIVVTTTDKDGGIGSGSTNLAVLNVAPTVAIRDNGSTPTTVQLSSEVTDPGEDDTFTYAWSVTKFDATGNGTPFDTGTPVDEPTFHFTREDNTTYSVALVVSDNSGGQDDDSILFVGGTDNAETITITVTLTTPIGEVEIVIQPVGGVKIPLGSIPAGNAIVIVANGGDDVVNIDFDLDIPVEVRAGMGNDTINSGSGNDLLDGGPGNDSIVAGDDDDTIAGGLGDDTIAGGEGNDSLGGGDGNTGLIFGDEGDDTIASGTGSETIFGGSAADTVDTGTDWVVESGDVDMKLTDSLLTGQGNAQLFDIDNAMLIGGDGDNLLDASEFTGQVHLVGGAGDDTLLGGSNDDTLDGGAGNDLLAGGGGNDTYLFDGDNLGSDVIDEQSVTASDTSSDSLDFQGFAASIQIDLSNSLTQEVSPGRLNLKLLNPDGLENVFGTPFADSIFGNQRNNLIIGGGSQDILNGAGGDDTLQGGDTNLVFLDFDSATGPGEHVYTPDERNQVRARLEADFAAFNFEFVIDPSGLAGDLATFEVMSQALDRFEEKIDSVVRVYRQLSDGSFQKLDYNGSPTRAFNDDGLELADAILLDVVLPFDGQPFPATRSPPGSL